MQINSSSKRPGIVQRGMIAAATLLGAVTIMVAGYQLVGATTAFASGCNGLNCGDQASCGTACYCNIYPPGDGTCHTNGQ
jgi:hypothetical protein